MIIKKRHRLGSRPEFDRLSVSVIRTSVPSLGSIGDDGSVAVWNDQKQSVGCSAFFPKGYLVEILLEVLASPGRARSEFAIFGCFCILTQDFMCQYSRASGALQNATLIAFVAAHTAENG